MSFWQKVQRGVSSAASEAEKQANIAKLMVEVNGVKGSISKKYEEFGVLTARLVQQNEISHTAFQAPLDEIAGQESHLHELEARIAEMRGQGPGPS